jgi:glutamate dehydrogenase/leucine dehydrogenase
VSEVAQDVFEFVADRPEYQEAQILRRIAEPDRIVSFRVCWEDDDHNIVSSVVGACRTTMRSGLTRAGCGFTKA